MPDGNNTIIYERPPHAREFIIWSLCTNPGADPRHNAWSGIGRWLSADIIERTQQVDGVIIWDTVCGTVGRPCPKLLQDSSRITAVAHYQLPPPCIYVLPATVPALRARIHDSTRPTARGRPNSSSVSKLLRGKLEEVNYVDFEVEYRGTDTVRRTRIRRGGVTVKESALTAIQRV